MALRLAACVASWIVDQHPHGAVGRLNFMFIWGGGGGQNASSRSSVCHQINISKSCGHKYGVSSQRVIELAAEFTIPLFQSRSQPQRGPDTISLKGHRCMLKQGAGLSAMPTVTISWPVQPLSGKHAQPAINDLRFN